MLVESLALTLFKNNGVDLHTATYYTLARTRIHGLSGFCEGVELLAALISHEWDKFWPQSEQARTEMLDWFNARTGNILRQHLSWSETDLPLMYRAERALQAICDKLQQVELKRIPRVENLLYFVQNTRKRFEQPAKYRTVTPLTQTAIRTLVYAPDSPEIVEERVPATPEVKIEVQTERLTVPEVGKKALTRRKDSWRDASAHSSSQPHSGGGKCTLFNNRLGRLIAPRRAQPLSGGPRQSLRTMDYACSSFLKPHP